MFNKYAQILTCINGLGVKTFSYLIPDGLKAEIKTGQPVLVPFGKMGLVNAFVTGFSNYLPENIKAKSITAILDDKPLFDIDYLEEATLLSEPHKVIKALELEELYGKELDVSPYLMECFPNLPSKYIIDPPNN